MAGESLLVCLFCKSSNGSFNTRVAAASEVDITDNNVVWVHPNTCAVARNHRQAGSSVPSVVVVT